MGACVPNQFIRAWYVESRRSGSSEISQIRTQPAGAQYAVAGRPGRRHQRAERGGKRPFMYVPGIDVPFHSTVLRSGGPNFRSSTSASQPVIPAARGHPNLVARPFELTREFVSVPRHWFPLR